MNTKKYLRHLFTIGILFSLLPACNKKDSDYERAIQVLITGYNGSNNVLQLAIDTTVYNNQVAYGKYIIKENSAINLMIAYTYMSGKKNQMLTLTDTVTKKVVYSRPLPETGTRSQFFYIHLDGKETALTPPAADASANKIGFYIHTPGENTPVDIFLYRKERDSEKEYREYIAQNVQPNSWVYTNYQPSQLFEKSQLGISSIYFTKAGTTDQWAFNDSEYSSKLSGSGMSLPLTGEKGLVLPYFIVPGATLDRVRMFYFPERLW